MGHTPSTPPVLPASQAYSCSRKGSWIQLCLPWPGHCGGVGVLGNGLAILLAPLGFGCSNELCAPSVLTAPLSPAAFKCAVMVLGVLFAACPCPLSPPHSPGEHSMEAHGDRQWQNPLTAATRPKPLASELSLPPTGRQSFSCPAAWCDMVPANGTGQPLQSPHLPTAPRCPRG